MTAPESWWHEELGSLIEAKYGKGLPQAKRKGGKVPVYGSNGIVGWHNEALTSGRTVIIGRKGSSGEVNFSDLPCWPIDTTYYIDAPGPFRIEFLNYLLRSLGLTQLDRSTAIPGLNREQLHDIEVPVPPDTQQAAIVSPITAVEDHRSGTACHLGAARRAIERFRQAVLVAACSGRLTADWRESHPGQVSVEVGSRKGASKSYSQIDLDELPEIPDEWRYVPIGAMFQVETGTTPSKKDGALYASEDGLPFFKPTDLGAGAEVRHAREHLSEAGVRRARLLPRGTVCVTSIGATIGKTGLLAVEGATNQQINAILPTEGVEPRFVYYACISPSFQRSIVVNSSETTMPIVNKGRFEGLRLPIPPSEEQSEIVRRVDALLLLADGLTSKVETASRRIERSSQAVLAKAFRGELVSSETT